jgi:hypothetical protein
MNIALKLRLLYQGLGASTLPRLYLLNSNENYDHIYKLFLVEATKEKKTF